MEWNPENILPEDFYKVACNVYNDDPCWIPENYLSLKDAFSARNKYFGKNSAWLDYRKDKTRLAGFYDPDLIIRGEKAAFFGYWETVDDYAVNRDLFADFENWAAGKGAQVIYGPINFTTYGANRIRLNKFEDGYFPGEPYNPEYYQALLEKSGYQLVQKYHSIIGDPRESFITHKDKIETLSDNLEKSGTRFVTLTTDYWLENLDNFYEFTDVIFSQNFAYSKLSLDDFRNNIGLQYANLFCQKTSVIALNGNDEIAGFFITFPDYSPLCRQGASTRLQLQEINFNKHFSLLQNPTLVGKTGGVHPDYRKTGLFTILSYRFLKASVPYYSKSIAATVREDNYSLSTGKIFLLNSESVVHNYGLFTKRI